MTRGVDPRQRSRQAAALLVAAIVSEVVGTLLLRVSDGFTRPLPALGTLVGYAVSMVLFARGLERGLSLGVAYGTLTSCGLAMATLASVAVFGDPLTLTQAVGLLLIGIGALGLQTRPTSARP